MGLLERLRTQQWDTIVNAGDSVAQAIARGNKVWISRTTHCLAGEGTRRAGGFIAVHDMIDAVMVRPGDCVLVGSAVGTAASTVTVALEAKQRGGTIIALTNVAFENDPDTIIEHPSGQRLHQVADLVVDVGGPLGDGVFEVDALRLRAIPHTGVTMVATMWMIFSEALHILRNAGTLPRLYECIMIEGSRARNAVQIDGYLRTGLGYLTAGEAERVRATE